jgi:hypothetical protein
MVQVLTGIVFFFFFEDAEIVISAQYNGKSNCAKELGQIVRPHQQEERYGCTGGPAMYPWSTLAQYYLHFKIYLYYF